MAGYLRVHGIRRQVQLFRPSDRTINDRDFSKFSALAKPGKNTSKCGRHKLHHAFPTIFKPNP